LTAEEQVAVGREQCDAKGRYPLSLPAMLSSDLVRSVLDSAPDAMVIIDASGAILFANYQVTALFGHDPATLIGQNVECLLPERFRARHVGYRRGYSSNVRVRPMGSGLDLFALRKDGSEFPVEISLSPAADGATTLVVAAIRDITDRRRIQIELRQAREEADRANQAKSRFLATASHDLRQPLQALSLLNGTMRRIVKGGDLAEALSQEEQAITAMSRLLNALLDISKLESGAIKPEITDFKVAALFEELRQEFATLAANKGLRLEIEPCADRVHSDPSLIGQVVRNLVSNAIKYTRQGGVRLRCLHEHELVHLEVLDTGIGIPPAELARIYDDFYQIGVSANTSRDGYGLGLSIVSRIVNLLGLKLDVRSEVGKGTAFSLELPAGGASVEGRPHQPQSSGPRKSQGTARVHVLLVEDDPRVRNATRMLLKVEGYDVTAAASLSEALHHASSHAGIGLLVTDYHLAAGETGVQVISAVRAVLGADLPAVLITGDTSAAVRELGYDARLRAASKPINPDELLELLRELVGS
jgi:PAS domain S-box-containing protein